MRKKSIQLIFYGNRFLSDSFLFTWPLRQLIRSEKECIMSNTPDYIELFKLLSSLWLQSNLLHCLLIINIMFPIKIYQHNNMQNDYISKILLVHLLNYLFCDFFEETYQRSEQFNTIRVVFYGIKRCWTCIPLQFYFICINTIYWRFDIGRSRDNVIHQL